MTFGSTFGRVLSPTFQPKSQAAVAGGITSLTDITGCKLWLDFSDIDTLFTDAGTTKVSSDDDKIYQVNDKSGNAYHHVQTTEGNRPLYKTNIKNSRSVARFDGDDTLGCGTNAIFKNAGSGFYLAVFTATASTKVDYRGICVVGTSAGNTLATLLVGHIEAGKAAVGGRRLSTDTGAFINGGSITNGTYYALGGKYDWANSNLYSYLNGNTTATKTDFQTDGNTVNTNNLFSRLGSNVVYFAGDICEVAAYSPCPSDDDIAKIFNYINNKWDLY